MYFELMARFRALSLYYKFVHWSLKSSLYYGDHLLADRLAGETEDVIDEIAEKGIGATGSHDGVLLPAVLTRVLEILKPYPMVVSTNAEFWMALLTMERDLAIWMDGAAAVEKNRGAQNQLIGYLETGLNRVYLVRARTMGYGPLGSDVDDDGDDN